MTSASFILRPIVALASLSVLLGVGHGLAPTPGTGAHDVEVADAPATSDARVVGSWEGFHGAPVRPEEIGSIMGRLSRAVPDPTEAENARERGHLMGPGSARVAGRGSGSTSARVAGNLLGAGASMDAPDPAPLALPQYRSREPEGYYDFYFTRAIYGGGGLGGRSFFRSSWAVDFPKADRQFLVVLGETLDLLRVPSVENAVNLADPELRKYPFLYTLEVGGMYLSQPQVEGLRNYLLAGGFLVVDDFWGAWEWRNFEEQIRRVFPGVEIEEIPLDHEIFHVFYDIEEILQVPNIGNAQAGRTSECGPCQPRVRGIFDDDGRLMVVINWNTDLGDAWEWSEQAVYPFEYSNFAYKMAVNFIVYAMTH